MYTKFVTCILLCLLSLAANAGTVTYIYTDQQGTPLLEADTQGNPTASFDYRPYGGQTLGASKDGPGYTGHVNDSDTALVYMQARFYDPAVGRFLNVDPASYETHGSKHFNRYAYVSDNPYTFTDPDGRQECRSCEMSYGAGVWLVIGDNPDAMRTWANGEQAATFAAGHGSAPLEGAAMAQSVSEFLAQPDFTPERLTTAAAAIGATLITKGSASKVVRSVFTERIGRFTKITEIRPGKGPGQTHAQYVRYKNEKGETIRTYKDSYDRAGDFKHRKPLTGGPEGRPVSPPPPKKDGDQ